jgi:predicted TPR repeat methyltransferase
MKNTFSNAPEFVNQLKDIERLIVGNDLEKAVVALNGLAKSAPRDPRLFLLGSRLAQASGNAEGVLQAAAKAREYAPQWPVATLHLATVLAQQGENEPAMALAAMAVTQATQQKTLGLELLQTVAGLAFALNVPEKAVVWLRQALQMDPLHVATRYKLGLALAKSGDLAGAIDSYSSILNADSANAPVLNARLHAYLGTGQKDLALKDADALVAQKPDNEEYLFYQTICRGEVPRTQPATLIAGLFDEGAARFDQVTVVGLKYKLPRHVAVRILEWHPERKADVLDLGCGTGLLGVALGAMDGVVVGVDLSSGMIEQASRHGVYDKFHQVNILDALHATPEGLYDVITALDVFPYVGALDAAIPDAYRILQVGGRLVFSCEAQAPGEIATEGNTDNGYVVLPSYRFAHQRDYVQTLVSGAGFQNVLIEDVVLRQEAAGPVHGFLVIAQKPEKSVRRSPKSAKPARRTG